MLHVLIGANAEFESLREGARLGLSVRWIVPKRAVPGDDAALYVPERGMVAVGKIVTIPEPSTFGKAPAYVASVGQLRLFGRPISLDAMAKAAPEWKWTTYPRTRTTLSAALAAKLNALFETAGTRRSQVGDQRVISAVEGMAREVRSLVRGRNNRLRRAALERAGGVCEVCGTDFSQVLDGAGTRILQVHHLAQLSLARTPQVTTLDDLAVVCPNCHSMLHLDIKQTMPIERLKALLARR